LHTIDHKMDGANSNGVAKKMCEDQKTSSDPVTPSKVLAIEDVKSEGCLLWAKIKGYSYWPGIVTVDPMDGMTVKIAENTSRSRVHVHFLGYSDMRAWVPYVNVMLFEGKVPYDNLASNAKNIKDYYPTKKYIKLFDKAVQKAEETYLCPQELRLKKLGLVYVLIDKESDLLKDSEESLDKTKIQNLNENANSNISDTVKSHSPENKPLTKKKIELAPKGKAGNVNGNQNVPKITTGFFKNHQPLMTPQTKENKSDADIFDFNDSEDQYRVDFRKNKQQREDIVLKKPMPKKLSTPKLSSSVKRKMGNSSSGSSSKKRKIDSVTVKVTSHNEGEAIITDLQENEQEDEFKNDTDDSTTSIGSLIWGRMAGFPYWPCFVTKSPTGGDFKRVFGKRKEYHAQFFNWNNESGWVSGAMLWCPINEYQAKAKSACPKGPNTPEGRNWYPPARLASRWKIAVLDAQKTAHMTRRDRYKSLIVSYGGLNKKTMPRTVAARKQLLIPSQSTNITNDQDTTKVVKHKELDRPSPASKKKVFLKSGLSLGKIELPKGWSYELCQTEGEKSNVAVKFHSPEGLAYDGVQNAVAHLLQQNCCPTGNIKRRRRRSYSTSSCIKEDGPGRFGWFLRCTDKMHFKTRPYCPDQVGQLEGPVEYLKDDSLPASWLVRTIRGRNETLYQSSSSFHKTPADNSTAEEFRFKDKVSVAQFLEGMGHPALEIEQLLFNYPNIARVAPKDGQEEEKSDRDNDSPAVGEDNAIRLDDLVAKTVTPCYVDMVKLPDIFLKHPCVRVKESNNEMLIRDADTGMFIAKKIIYE